LTIDDVALCAS